MPQLLIRLMKKSGPVSEDGGDDALIEHKAVAGSLKGLDALAKKEGVKPLSEFVSEDPENVFDLVDDEDEAEELMEKLPPVRYFAPEDALPTLKKLIALIGKDGELPGIKNSKKVLAELRDLQTTLEVGVKKKAKFRFYKEF